MMLTFNVIYIPGTVRLLLPLTRRFLLASSCRFRLISNGCSEEEKTLLRDACRRQTRFEYFELSEEVLVHGEALTRLFNLETSEFFCFMDPDILVTGDFMGEIGPRLKDRAAVTSGRILWSAPEKEVAGKDCRELQGGHYHGYGFCFGSTFFAVYRRRDVQPVVRKTGVAFQQYKKRSAIPESVRSRLTSIGLQMNFFDTAKVLNILIQLEGGSVIHFDSPSLLHLGSLSTRLWKNAGNRRNPNLPFWIRFLKRSVNRVVKRDEKARSRTPKAVTMYFSELMARLAEGEAPPPDPVFEDAHVTETVRRASRQVADFFQETNA